MRKVKLTLIMLILAANCSNSNAQIAFTYSQICKAGIATVMGRDPIDMFVGVDGRDFLLVSYERDGDGELFTYKCRLLESRIHWGNIDGRWRNDSMDSTLTYYFAGEHLIIQDQFPDGSMNEEQFTRSQLGSE